MDLGVIVTGGAALALLGALVWWREPMLSFAARSADYLRDVRAEVRKVTWPGWEDLRKSTIVIIIVVIIFGIVIGIMDWFFSKLLIDFLGRVFA